ncbi:hypothetical protein MKW98_003994 [Papaver atlanticum]|uniref:Uncharacterized protein n=1 Tax=Papaver atlanticum TaxID=357466 RepID=A0AAD4T0V5_9MAGN|nr:hypothetical protein MKW98_003994 [Papaver atlanticum]
MHTLRLLHLVGEAHAEICQKLKEFNEYCESAKQFVQTCQSGDVFQQFRKNIIEYIEEKMNSLRLSEQKLDHSVRLAEKCVKIWAKSKDISSTETEGIWKMLTSEQLGVVKFIISELGEKYVMLIRL